MIRGKNTWKCGHSEHSKKKRAPKLAAVYCFGMVVSTGLGLLTIFQTAWWFEVTQSFCGFFQIGICDSPSWVWSKNCSILSKSRASRDAKIARSQGNLSGARLPGKLECTQKASEISSPGVARSKKALLAAGVSLRQLQCIAESARPLMYDVPHVSFSGTSPPFFSWNRSPSKNCLLWCCGILIQRGEFYYAFQIPRRQPAWHERCQNRKHFCFICWIVGHVWQVGSVNVTFPNLHTFGYLHDRRWHQKTRCKAY